MRDHSRTGALDTFHAAVLFLGVFVLFNHAVSRRWGLLYALGVLLAWTLGYWAVVKYVLPTRWSGQTRASGRRVYCLLRHNWAEQSVEDASAHQNGITYTGLKHVEYECERCERKLISVMTPEQLEQARKEGAPPRV